MKRITEDWLESAKLDLNNIEMIIPTASFYGWIVKFSLK